MMKKIILVQTVFLFGMTSLLSSQFDYKIKTFVNKKSATTKQYDKLADTLISNFLARKNLKIQDIPSPMKNELNYKKEILIQKLTDLDTNRTTKNKSKQPDSLVGSLFEDFAQRLNFIKISDNVNEIISALKEACEKNPNDENCSLPKINPNKLYLFRKAAGK